MPIGVQLIIWIVLPLWGVFSAISAYRNGTMTSYRKYNLIAIFMGSISLAVILFTILIETIL